MSSTRTQTKFAKPAAGTETAGYLDVAGEQVYYVWHRPQRPVAQILLPGHFVTERPFAYALWTRWARCLADHGISALRFDYRGCGESSGEFSNFTVRSWLEDCRAMHDFLKSQEPQLPLVFGGIGLGGLLSSQLFQEGLGNAMLLWAPSATGAAALRDTLLRRLAFDMTAGGRPKTWADYEASLQNGESIEGAGYTLTAALWRDASAMKLALPEGSQDKPDSRGRGWKVVKLGQPHVPLIPGGGLWQALNPGLRMRLAPLNPDLSGFYEENAAWIIDRLKEITVKS